jgi:hypothetical protein
MPPVPYRTSTLVMLGPPAERTSPRDAAGAPARSTSPASTTCVLVSELVTRAVAAASRKLNPP